MTPAPGRRLGLTLDQTRARLDRLAGTYDRRFLETDPAAVVRRHARPEDREVVGLLAAGLAYGNVRAIRGSLERVLAILGPRPSAAVDALTPADLRRFAGFRHRFTRGEDVGRLLLLVARARGRAGSLGRFFSQGDPDPAAPTLERAIDAFGARLFALDPSLATPGARWLLPVPANGSACKRTCLWLRWMVRPDDGIDLGLWPEVDRARLVVPLDVHVERVARALGWTARRSGGWKTALEVTATLRRLDPADPTRYDFALCRLGMLGRVRARHGRLRPRDLRAALGDLP